MSSSSSPTIVPQMFSYFEGLLEEDKRCYKSKIGLINGNDPFGKVVGGEPISGVVPFDSCDLVSGSPGKNGTYRKSTYRRLIFILSTIVISLF